MKNFFRRFRESFFTPAINSRKSCGDLVSLSSRKMVSKVLINPIYLLTFVGRNLPKFPERLGVDYVSSLLDSTYVDPLTPVPPKFES